MKETIFVLLSNGRLCMFVVLKGAKKKISGSGQIRWTQTERMQISEVSFQDLLSIML